MGTEGLQATAGANPEGPRHDPKDRPAEIGERGRYIYGATPPGGATPCARTSPLSPTEIGEVVAIIAHGRTDRTAVELPERLRTRHWPSVVEVILQLDRRLARTGAGWKIGAASEEVRRAEGLPSPSPGRLYEGGLFPSGAELGPELFINYRNIECEFAFRLGLDFPARVEPYTEHDARAPASIPCSRRWNSATPSSSIGTVPAAISVLAWITGAAPP